MRSVNAASLTGETQEVGGMSPGASSRAAVHSAKAPVLGLTGPHSGCRATAGGNLTSAGLLVVSAPAVSSPSSGGA